MGTPKDAALARMAKALRHIVALEALLTEATTDAERNFIIERMKALLA